MGTYHSFISQPLTKPEADELLKSIKKVIEESKYDNSIEYFKVIEMRNMHFVVGVYKNLGYAPVELILMSEFNWATVSNEGDFFKSES